MSRVFLSHSSRDNRQAMALQAWLVDAEPGLKSEIFLDLDRDTGIAAGTRWKEALRRANERCEAVICLLSEHWDDSHECKTEYRSAEDRGKPIFPVRLEQAAGRDITAEWQRCDLFGDGPKTAIRITGDPHTVEFLTEGLVRLRNGLRAAGIAPDSFVWPPENDPDRAPYRGWQPLEEVDAAVYFGRDAQINRALMALRSMRASTEDRLLVVLGPSGAGKSSFIRAGVLPRLRRDDRHFLTMPVIRPERHPVTGPHGLAVAIHGLRAASGLSGPALGVVKAGAADPNRVRAWLVEAQQAASNQLLNADDITPPTVVMSIDQAEELFVADAHDQCQQLISVLTALLGDRSLPILAIVTIRSDSYEPLQTSPALAEIGTRPFDDLKPLPAAQFREAICGPAERANEAGDRFSWSAELVERLLADCAHGADVLPLLSLILARLYTDYRGQEIGLTEYEALGGLHRVVQNEIDEVLSADPDERTHQLDHLHAAFIPWLATVHPDSDLPMRRMARMTDLPPDTHSLIDALVARRLLVKDERDGEVVVEVALESLLRQWDELAEWLRAEADDLKGADEIEQAARLWDRNERQEDWLLEGGRLDEAETLAAKPGFRDRLNTAREFLVASHQRQDRRAREREESAQALAAAEERAKIEAQNHAQVLARRARVLRALLALTAVIAVVAVVAGLWGWSAEREANERLRDKVAQSLYANARSMLRGDWPGDSSDALAMQMVLAARSFPSQQQYADYQLAGALHHQRDLLKIVDHPATVYRVAVSPDGTRILTANGDGTVHQLDSQTGALVGNPLSGHRIDVVAAVYSPNGSRIASAGIDGTVRLWDASTGRQLGEPLQVSATDVAFSPDGRILATASGDKTIHLWDTTRQTSGQPLQGHREAITSVAFSPDGHTLATGSMDKTIRLWDTTTHQPIREPLQHPDPVMTVDFSPDGRILAAGSAKTIRLWDTTTHQPIGDELRGHDGIVSSVAFSPEGRRLASGSEDRTIRIWDLATRRQVGILAGHQSAVISVAFFPDSRRLVSSADDNSVRVWDAVSWQPITKVDRAWAQFVDGGRTIAVGGDNQDRTVRYFDSDTGLEMRSSARVSDAGVQLVSPIDRRRSVSVDATDHLQFWDVPTGVPIGRPILLRENDFLPRFVYGEESHRILLAIAPNILEVRNVASTATVGPQIRPDSAATALSLSPDGRTVVTGHPDWTIRLWDARTGKQHGEPMKNSGWVTNLVFSDDGRFVAAADRSHQVRVWDTRTQQQFGPTLMGDAHITSLAVSPHNALLAAGGSDGHLQVFDIVSGVQYGPAWVGHSDLISNLEFSPDGTRLLSSGWDGTVRVWPIPTVSSDALCDKLTHNMSRADWDDWVSPDIDYVPVCPGLPIADEGDEQ